MILKILILDNNKEDRRKTKSLLEEVLIQCHMKYQIDLAAANEVHQYPFKNINLIIMETQFDAIDGFELAKTIRRQFPGIRICFMTYDKDRADQGYCLHALRYLYKFSRRDDLISNLRAILHENYYLYSGFKDKRVSIDPVHFYEIYYVEYIDRHSRLHMGGRRDQNTTYSLGYWIQKLESIWFVQTYRSYVVNLLWVMQYDRKEKMITMSNGDKIPVSLNYRNNFESSYYGFKEMIAKMRGIYEKSHYPYFSYFMHCFHLLLDESILSSQKYISNTN